MCSSAACRLCSAVTSASGSPIRRAMLQRRPRRAPSSAPRRPRSAASRPATPAPAPPARSPRRRARRAPPRAARSRRGRRSPPRRGAPRTPAPPRPARAGRPRAGRRAAARANVSRAAGCPERASALPEPEQQRAAARRIGLALRLQRLQRPPVVPGGLLVREHRRRLPRPPAARSRSPCPRDRGAGSRSSGARARPGGTAKRGAIASSAAAIRWCSRTRRDALCCSYSASRTSACANTNRSTSSATSRISPAAIAASSAEMISSAGASISASRTSSRNSRPDHRRDRQHLVGRLVEPREPPRDHLLDALGHADVRPRAAASPRRRTGCRRCPRTGARISSSLTSWPSRASTSACVSAASSPSSGEPLERRLAAQPRQQLGQLVAALLRRLAHRRDHQQLHRLGVLEHVRRAAAPSTCPPTAGRRGSAPPGTRARRTPAAA